MTEAHLIKSDTYGYPEVGPGACQGMRDFFTASNYGCVPHLYRRVLGPTRREVSPIGEEGEENDDLPAKESLVIAGCDAINPIPITHCPFCGARLALYDK